ncbi:MAG TPA: HD-GYP domain-containing protein [Neobacillus sp.]
MPKSVKIYVVTLFILSLGQSIYWFLSDSPHIGELGFLIIFIILAEALRVPVIVENSKEQVKISWSIIISIASLIGLNITDSIILNLVAAFACSLYPKRLPFIKLVYNISSLVCTATFTYFLSIQFQKFFPFITSIPLAELIYIPGLYLLISFSFNIILLKILTRKDTRDLLTSLVSPYLHIYALFGFVGGISGFFYNLYGPNSLFVTSLLVMLIVISLMKTANNAYQKIQELEDSNKKSADLAKELDSTLEQFIQTLTATVDARDPYTFGHSYQVSNYAFKIASEMGLSEEEAETIRVAGLLHDIGKISIPESIFYKEGKLTYEEYEIMKQHAEIGEEILSDIPRLKEVADLVGKHHERFNGTGYPSRLKTQDIPIGAHILGVADTLDAILSSRSYKKEKTVDEAMEEFERSRGTLFHPEVVDSLLRLRQTLGDDVFTNSANLIDQDIIVGKVRTNRNILDWLNKRNNHEVS